MRRVRKRLGSRALLPVCSAVLVTGAILPAPSAAETEPDLALPFDGGSVGDQVSLRSSGTAEVDVAISAVFPGTVTAVPHGRGNAARMEPFDALVKATPAVITVTSLWGDPLDPGSAPFRFGAEFKLDSRSAGSGTDNGNNLIQRGLAADDSQYKIQVDSNRPSCRVRGSEGAVEVRAGHDVTPGEWYRVRCTRVGSTVTLKLVTYDEDSTRVVEEWSDSGAIGGLSFPRTLPISIGGKVDGGGDVIGWDSDQFNGVIDNAHFDRL